MSSLALRHSSLPSLSSSRFSKLPNQVPRPPPKEQKTSGMGQLAEFELTRYKELLEGLKPLGENDHPACLCASPDETRVYYTSEDKDYLITNGQTAELHLTRTTTTSSAQVSSTEPGPL